MWRWLWLVLAAVAFAGIAHPALGQGQERPNIQEVLMAAALTEADVPRGLVLNRERSGPRAGEQGGPSYTASFMPDGTGDPSLVGVVNIVGQYPDAAAGMDALTNRFRDAIGGSQTELPTPAVGEASRAFTLTSQVMGGAFTTSTTVVAVRRGDLVGGVAVAALGSTPQLDVALRLAESVDRRLAAALGPGPQRGGS
jgi:hypothetical protein